MECTKWLFLAGAIFILHGTCVECQNFTQKPVNEDDKVVLASFADCFTERVKHKEMSRDRLRKQLLKHLETGNLELWKGDKDCMPDGKNADGSNLSTKQQNVKQNRVTIFKDLFDKVWMNSPMTIKVKSGFSGTLEDLFALLSGLAKIGWFDFKHKSSSCHINVQIPATGAENGIFSFRMQMKSGHQILIHTAKTESYKDLYQALDEIINRMVSFTFVCKLTAKLTTKLASTAVIMI
jgi:hypothetical protein